MTPSSDAAAPWAADALLSGGEEPVPGIRVREVTAGVLCVLERIGSPFATGVAPAASDGLAPWLATVYAMTRGARESWAVLAKGREAFEAAALEWADGLAPAALDALLGACARSASRLRAAANAGGDGGDAPADPPHAATAG